MTKEQSTMDIKSLLKSEVESFYGREYIGGPVSLEQAVEIVRDLVNDLLDEIDIELAVESIDA